MSVILDYILQADPSGMLTALGKTEKALKDVDHQADKTTKGGSTAAKTLGDRFEHAGARMQGFGRTMTLGVTAPLTAAFGVMAHAAAEDAESQEILARNLKQMGGASEDAVEGAEDYIAELARMSGVADDELRPALSKLVGATGDVGKAQDLLALALDTSVSKGKPLEAVSQALARAYQGSTGALGKLGIATKDAEGKARSFTQIQADLKTQVDGAAQAAGETGAGGWRRAKVAFEELQEALGAKLLPAFTKLADIANGILGFFEKLGPVGSNAAVGLGALAIALGPIASGVGTIMANGKGITAWFRSFGSAAAGVGADSAAAATGIAGLAGRFGWFASTLKGLGIAAIIAGITTAIERYATAGDRFKATNADMFAHAKEGPTGLQEAWLQLQRRMNEIDNNMGVWRTGWNYLWGDTRAAREEFQRLGDGMRISIDVLNEVAAKTGKTTAELWQLADTLKVDLSTGSEEAKTALENAALGADGMAGSLDDMSESAEDALDPLDELKKALDGIFDPLLNWDEAKASFVELGLEMDRLAQDTNTAGLERSLAAQRIARDVVESYQTMMAAAQAHGGTEADQARITQQHIDTLATLGRKFPEVRGVAESYIAKLRETPGDLLTNARMTAPVQFADNYKNALNAIPTERTTTLRMQFGDASTEPFLLRMLIANDLHKSGLSWQQINALGKTGHFARGGRFDAGQAAIVGEEGPELVTFGAAGRVHDAATTQRVMGQTAGTVVNITVPVHVEGSIRADRDLVSAVEDGLARQLRQSGSLAFLN